MILKKLFNKLFLVKEIKSKNGELHFRRYRLFSSPIFRIYIHKIYKKDDDIHLHSHPWNFTSILLKGSYEQEYWDHPLDEKTSYKILKPGDMTGLSRYEFHKISKIRSGPVWTLFFAYGFRGLWGYLTENGFVDHKTYRILKNNDQLPGPKPYIEKIYNETKKKIKNII